MLDNNLGVLDSNLRVDETGHLLFSIYQISSIEVEQYSIRMMRVKGDEFCLNAGRFHNFKHRQQTHMIALGQPHTVTHDGEAVIDWIAEHVNHTWSMHLLPDSDILEFSFVDSTDAGFFTLRWR